MAQAKWVMLADAVRCVNCKACVVACRAEWETPLGQSRNWMREVVTVADDNAPRLSLVSGRCQHCDDAPCVAYCPSGASYQREDGLVLVDKEICSGCEMCVEVCPYDARFKHPSDGTVAKCTFCQPKIDSGAQPACVDVCFNNALIFGDRNDPNAEVSKLLEQKQWMRLITDSVNTEPNHYYPEGTQIDETVLPREKQPPIQATLLSSVVNPVAKYGVGGMLGLFGAAGIMKLIQRRDDASSKEGSDG